MTAVSRRRSGLDTTILELAGGVLDPVAPVVAWRRPASVTVKDGLVRWSRSLGDEVRPTRSLLTNFINLRNGNETAFAKFTEKWGPLNLCAQHRLPCSHVPERVWRYVTVTTGDLLDVVDGREVSDATDSYNPCRPAGMRVFHEEISDWRRFAAEAVAIIELSASLRLGVPGEADAWEPVASMIQAEGHTVTAESLAMSEALLPDVDGRSNRYDRPRRMTKSERCKRQRAFLASAVQRWLDYGDVRLVPDLSAETGTFAFGAGTLFGALAVRLALVAAGVGDQWFICKACRRPFSRASGVRSGEATYCHDPACKRASRAAAQRAFRQRQRAQAVND